MPAVLVTGASRGIGLAITRHMSDLGWDVYATARSAADLRDLDRMPRVHPRLAGDPEKVVAAVDRALTSRRPKRRYRCDNLSRA
ncbi:SDR family NAD(P)-dependent oxidoreductase [Rhodococcus oryzae]|uniref:SDR family NAD(P)-dependent oxidoreductase n=1 Tax=Rhodococcus oryzae TaxID=2571143 RepID=UPI0037A37160